MSIGYIQPFTDPLKKLTDQGGTLAPPAWSTTPQPASALPNGGMNITTQATGSGAWALPEWAYGGNQLGGGTYLGGGRWAAGPAMAAGSDVYGYKLPTGYNGAEDRGGLALNGQNNETFWSRFLRFARDYNTGGMQVDQAMQTALDRIRRDNGGTLQGTGFAEVGTTPAPGQAPAPGTAPTVGQPGTAPRVPAPNPAAGQPPTNGGLGGQPGVNGGLSGAGSDILSGDPNLAYAYMMRQLGFDPSAPSRFGDYMKKRFSPLLQARLAASQVGDNSNYLDTIGNTINQFGQGMFQQGGNFFGQQRGIADQVLGSQGTADFLGGIQDQQQVEQYLNQLATLKYAGSNPMIQQSIADTLQRGQEQYDYEAFNQLNGGQSQGDPYLEWLRRNPAYNRYLGVR